MHSSLNRKAAKMLMVLSCVAVAAQSAAAQVRPRSGGFGMGYTDVGPVIGLGGLGDADISIGGRFERAIKALPDLANGTLGLQVAFDYYSFSNSFISVKHVPIGVTANYHFRLDEPKFDPFVGIGLGYKIISCDIPGTSNIDCANSDIYVIARAGMRYFFGQSTAFYADIGAGAATLNLGLMFKLP